MSLRGGCGVSVEEEEKKNMAFEVFLAWVHYA